MPAEPPRRILCPVDFSALSALALRYAGALASCGPAQLTACHAHWVSPPAYFTPGQLEELQKQMHGWLAEADRTLAAFVKSTLGSGAAEVQVRVVEALPVEGIRRVASEISADLIVMGTHGRSGLSRYLLGSVAEHLLRESDIPILTVRGEAPAEPLRIRHILCPVNNSAAARRALAYTTRLAACLDAEVTVLHVREDSSRDSIGELCAWVEEQDRSHCTIHEVTRSGEAAREIIAAAREQACELLVIGAQHRLFFDSTVIGSTTVRVVRHAPCPVLTVIERPA